MTELEKEIRKYLKKTFHHEYYDDVVMVMGFAEPREKQIAELTEQNTSLLTSVENLNKSVQELESQIEKMKCCENCGKEFTKECAWWKRAEENRQINTCKDWEIKEK